MISERAEQENEELIEVEWNGALPPEWAPLNRVVPIRGAPVSEWVGNGTRRLCAVLTRGDFMWMGVSVRRDGAGVIHMYKHRGTRRYLLIDTAGLTYRVVQSRVAADWRRSLYAPVGTAEALELVLA
jgi:hypothetical protein